MLKLYFCTKCQKFKVLRLSLWHFGFVKFVDTLFTNKESMSLLIKHIGDFRFTDPPEYKIMMVLMGNQLSIWIMV